MTRGRPVSSSGPRSSGLPQRERGRVKTASASEQNSAGGSSPKRDPDSQGIRKGARSQISGASSKLAKGRPKMKNKTMKASAKSSNERTKPTPKNKSSSNTPKLGQVANKDTSVQSESDTSSPEDEESDSSLDQQLYTIVSNTQRKSVVKSIFGEGGKKQKGKNVRGTGSAKKLPKVQTGKNAKTTLKLTPKTSAELAAKFRKKPRKKPGKHKVFGGRRRQKKKSHLEGPLGIQQKAADIYSFKGTDDEVSVKSVGSYSSSHRLVSRGVVAQDSDSEDGNDCQDSLSNEASSLEKVSDSDFRTKRKRKIVPVGSLCSSLSSSQKDCGLNMSLDEGLNTEFDSKNTTVTPKVKRVKRRQSVAREKSGKRRAVSKKKADTDVDKSKHKDATSEPTKLPSEAKTRRLRSLPGRKSYSTPAKSSQLSSTDTSEPSQKSSSLLDMSDTEDDDHSPKHQTPSKASPDNRPMLTSSPKEKHKSFFVKPAEIYTESSSRARIETVKTPESNSSLSDKLDTSANFDNFGSPLGGTEEVHYEGVADDLFLLSDAAEDKSSDLTLVMSSDDEDDEPVKPPDQDKSEPEDEKETVNKKETVTPRKGRGRPRKKRVLSRPKRRCKKFLIGQEAKAEELAEAVSNSDNVVEVAKDDGLLSVVDDNTVSNPSNATEEVDALAKDEGVSNVVDDTVNEGSGEKCAKEIAPKTVRGRGRPRKRKRKTGKDVTAPVEDCADVKPDVSVVSEKQGSETESCVQMNKTDEDRDEGAEKKKRGWNLQRERVRRTEKVLEKKRLKLEKEESAEVKELMEDDSSNALPPSLESEACVGNFEEEKSGTEEVNETMPDLDVVSNTAENSEVDVLETDSVVKAESDDDITGVSGLRRNVRAKKRAKYVKKRPKSFKNPDDVLQTDSVVKAESDDDINDVSGLRKNVRAKKRGKYVKKKRVKKSAAVGGNAQVKDDGRSKPKDEDVTMQNNLDGVPVEDKKEPKTIKPENGDKVKSVETKSDNTSPWSNLNVPETSAAVKENGTTDKLVTNGGQKEENVQSAGKQYEVKGISSFSKGLKHLKMRIHTKLDDLSNKIVGETAATQNSETKTGDKAESEMTVKSPGKERRLTEDEDVKSKKTKEITEEVRTEMSDTKVSIAIKGRKERRLTKEDEDVKSKKTKEIAEEVHTTTLDTEVSVADVSPESKTVSSTEGQDTAFKELLDLCRPCEVVVVDFIKCLQILKPSENEAAVTDYSMIDESLLPSPHSPKKSFSPKKEGSTLPELSRSRTVNETRSPEKVKLCIGMSPKAEQKRMNDSQSEMKDIQSEEKDIQSEVKDIQSEVKDSQSEVKDSQSEVKDIQSEVKDIPSEVKDIQSEVKDCQSEVKDIQSEVKDIQSEVKDSQSEVKDIQLEVNTQEALLDNDSKANVDEAIAVKKQAAPASVTKEQVKYRCLHCRYTTNVRGVMEEHIYNHTSLVPYSCGHCSAIFGTKSGVNVHTRRQHKGMTTCVVKNTNDIVEEDHYTTASRYEELGGNIPVPPLPGNREIQPSLEPKVSSVSRGETSAVRSSPRSRIPVLQVADPKHTYYQCKHCTFSSNEKQAIEWHVSEKHPEDREIICVYCKKTLLKGDASLQLHFKSVHPGAQVAVQFSPDYTEVGSPGKDQSLKKLKPLLPKVAPSSPTFSQTAAVSTSQTPPKSPICRKSKRTARKTFRQGKSEKIATSEKSSLVNGRSKEDEDKPPIIIRIPKMYVRDVMSSQSQSASENSDTDSPSKAATCSEHEEESSQAEDCQESTETKDEIAETSTGHIPSTTAEQEAPIQLKISSVVSLSENKPEDESLDSSPTKSTLKKLYTCKFCSYSTKEKAYIINHIEFVHQMEYQYNCPYCSLSGSMLKNNIVKHMEREHSGVREDVSFDLVDQERYFVVSDAHDTSEEWKSSANGNGKKLDMSDSSSVIAEKGGPLNLRAKHGKRPVSMVGPMIKGQAFIPASRTDTVGTAGDSLEEAQQSATVNQAIPLIGSQITPVVLAAPVLNPIVPPTITQERQSMPVRPPQVSDDIPATIDRQSNSRVPKPPPLIPLGLQMTNNERDLPRSHIPPPPLVRAPEAATSENPRISVVSSDVTPIVIQPLHSTPRPTPSQRVAPMPNNNDEDLANRAEYSVFNLTGNMSHMPLSLPADQTRTYTNTPPVNPFPAIQVNSSSDESPSREELDKFKVFQVPRQVSAPRDPSRGVIPSDAIARSSHTRPSVYTARSMAPILHTRPPSTVNCLYCEIPFHGRDALHQHLLSHGPDILWTCPYCPLSNHMSRARLEQHIRNIHPGQEVTYVPYGI